MDAASIARLVGLGLGVEELLELEFTEAAVEYPAGWRERGNRLYVAGGVQPRPLMIVDDQLLSAATGTLIVLASPIDNLAAFLVTGSNATVFVGPECWLPQTQLHCGESSSIVLRRLVTCTWSGSVDARNGGSVFADIDQLWSSRVYIATDDMHAMRDLQTGDRINRRGCNIVLGTHVWLGLESAVTGDVTLGDNTVVGMRSVVRNREFPAAVAIGGTPAKVLRSGVTWSRDDLP